MKLAIYHNLPSGGARRALQEVCTRLAARHTLDVFTPTTSDETFLSSHEFASQLNEIPFSTRRPIRGGVYLNDLRRLLDLRDLEAVCKETAGIIDAGGYDAVLVDGCRFTQAPSVLHYLSSPSVYYCHEPPRRFIDKRARPSAAPLSPYQRARRLWHLPAELVYDWITSRLDVRNVGSASVVLTNSQHTRGVIRRYYGLDSAIAYLGVDADRFQPGVAPPEGYVLSVGAMEAHKGFDFLIRALARCPEPRPHLVLAGNTDTAGVSTQLRRLAARLGVALEIHIGISHEQLSSLYREAIAFVYAPYAEPFGLVVLEAMASGLPVVAVSEGGPLETVQHGVTGLLVRRDEQAFADATHKVTADADLRLQMGRRGREQVLARWSWDAAAARVENELFSLVRPVEAAA